jgi:hypothetical protein
LQGVNTEIFADDFLDRIFDTEIVAGLGHTLDYNDYNVRKCAVEIFTTSIAQGALSSIVSVVVLKYLQMACGTRYFILRLLPHLDVHWAMKIPTSGRARCKSSQPL